MTRPTHDSKRRKLDSPTVEEHEGLQRRGVEGGKLTGGGRRINQASLSHRAVQPEAITGVLANNSAPAIQTKLVVGQPGDKYEQEADRVAEIVMRMPDPISQSPKAALTPIQQLSSGSKKHPQLKTLDEKEDWVQTKAKTGQVPEITPALEAKIQSQQGKGEPLPESTKVFMESRFEHNFSAVHVHANRDSAELNHALRAKAFTLGLDIYFGTNQCNFESGSGKLLLAHELMHVVQQNRSQISNSTVRLQFLDPEQSVCSIKNDAKQLRTATRLEELFELYATNDEEFSIGPFVYDLAWIRSVGQKTIQDEIRRRLDLKKKHGETDHLNYFLIYIDKMRGNKKQKSWLHDAVKWRMKEHEALDTEILSPNNEDDTRWEKFAEAFEEEFASILHVFLDQERTNLHPDAIEIRNSDNISDYKRYDPRSFFTTSQRDKLMSFFKTRKIPEQLFNGDDIGNTTAQQRILMSAHILANGKYRPQFSEFDQKVHARMCFHWAHLVHHYAGVTPSGSLNRGLMGCFDMYGDLVLGSGKNQGIWFGEKNLAETLPEMEGTILSNDKGLIGPIPTGTGHEDAWEKEQEILQENPEKSPRIHRRSTLSMADFGKIRSGDWIWCYNANASAGGAHSVIFSHWEGKKQKTCNGVSFRRAIVYSQGQPKTGGRKHAVNLGDHFIDKPVVPVSSNDQCGSSKDVKQLPKPIVPIVSISRVSENARPARSVEEIFPNIRNKKRLQKINNAFLKRVQKKYKRPVDLRKLKDFLHQENIQLINTLSNRLTKEKRAFLLRDNNFLAQSDHPDNLKILISLTELLRAYKKGAVLLDDNMSLAYSERLNEEYAHEVEIFNQESTILQMQIEDIGLEINSIDEAIDSLSEIKDIQKQIKETEKQKNRISRKLRRIEEEINRIERKMHRVQSKIESSKNQKNVMIERRLKRIQESKILVDKYWVLWNEKKTLISNFEELEKMTNKWKESQEKTSDISDLSNSRNELFGSKLRRKIGALKRELKKMKRKRDVFIKENMKMQRRLPYGLVHPGLLGNRKLGHTTGKISSLFNMSQMEQFLIEE
jgi:uncharacterized protein Smg (DUF494 family)